MDFKDNIAELSRRISATVEHAKTEEAVKTAFILPFLAKLGYDVFNPTEVIPELTADHGVKKGEKVDYAIKLDGKIVILIECKQPGAPLEAKHAGQLFRYFSVTDAKFGVLTDGIRYLFFSDLEKENKMDERPFFEFNLANYSDNDVDELKKFTKPGFDFETILSTASNLKYMKALNFEVRKEFIGTPSEELVKIFTARVYDGRFTAQVKDQFTELLKRSFDNFLKESINSKLKSAFEPEATKPAGGADIAQVDGEQDSDVDTTAEEIDAHRIIQAIGAELVDVERIVMRDAKSYCAILFDDNNRKPIVRLYFNKKKLAIGVFIGKDEQKFDIGKLSEIYKQKALILQSVQQYIVANDSK